jgi:hypothetical protein
MARLVRATHGRQRMWVFAHRADPSMIVVDRERSWVARTSRAMTVLFVRHSPTVRRLGKIEGEHHGA